MHQAKPDGFAGPSEDRRYKVKLSDVQPVATTTSSWSEFAETSQNPIRYLVGSERNPAARRACIAHYRATCQVCDMDFGEVYGAVGAGYIHVHHVTPLSEVTGEREIDPVTDLIPVCPNCHAMLHRTQSPSIDALKEFVAHRRGGR